MASGFIQRFNGKIKAGVLWLGTGGGGIVDSASGIAGKPQVAQRLAIAVTATANTDFTMSLPPNATLTGITVYTSTAFLAATDAKIQAGVSAGDATYLALTSIKAAGVVVTALAGAGLRTMPSGSPNLFLRVVQTGTTSATGAATAVISYVMP
jgi:hypothetical protein